jgi:hypothetical protein
VEEKHESSVQEATPDHSMCALGHEAVFCHVMLNKQNNPAQPRKQPQVLSLVFAICALQAGQASRAMQQVQEKPSFTRNYRI